MLLQNLTTSIFIRQYPFITSTIYDRLGAASILTKLDVKKDDKPNYIPRGIEIQIIEQLLDPTMIDKTITEKCELLGVSRQTYYTHMSKPGFSAYCKALVYETIKHNSLPMIQAAVKAAKNGSFQHFKLLMEMGDFHTEEKNVNLEGNVAIEHIVTFGVPGIEAPKREIIEIVDDPDDDSDDH